MAMTREEARMAAIKLRALKPELKGMSLDSLIAKIMANEGDANVGRPVMTPDGMSRETAFEGVPQEAIAQALMLQPPQTITPASPAPMRPGVQLVAPKPVAQPVPGVGGPLERPSLLPDDVRQMAMREAQPAQVVEERAPVEIEDVAGTPKEGTRPSRYRELLNQTLAELNSREQLIAQAQEQGVEVPAAEQSRIATLTDRAQRLKGYIQAEEAAQIPEEIRSVLDRQEGRFARQEELIKEAKSRAPWEALAQASFALGQGRGGERFSEALARGLQAGLQSYGSARRENISDLQELEGRKDAAVLKRYDLLQKARDDAIRMIDAGQTMDKDIMEVAKMRDEDVLRSALMDPTISKAKAEAKLKEIEAKYAPEAALAAIDKDRASAEYYRSGRGGGSDPNKPMTENQRLTKLNDLRKERRKYKLAEANAFTPKQKAAAAALVSDIDTQIAELEGRSPYMQTPKGPLANKPDYVYTPGKGLSSAK